MREIEPSEVPSMKFFFHWKNDYLQILASAHSPLVQKNKNNNKIKQASKYCSDLVWTRRFGFLNQV